MECSDAELRTESHVQPILGFIVWAPVQEQYPVSCHDTSGSFAPCIAGGAFP